ncbi:hypothetical protein Glove_161g64 [Diversispora epigaea]|uniref:Uncharacterized protein n=1 Tax=Diversispora epigaea TaxID=1348612 RepID=A0A397IU73_9GLOM|nr:hypothetical protein Glove_161g64 [Diversispora epigaea]
MKIIRRKAIITESSSKEIPKTPIALKYSKKLYEFCIQNAEIYIQTRMNDLDLEKEMKLGFEKFLECLDVYLEIYYKNLSEHEKIDMIFHIYGVEMNADEIFEYTSDNGVCFAQVLLITEIIMNYEEPMHLALVQWYDFTSSRYMTHFYCSATISARSVSPPVVSPSSSPERCRLFRQPSWECCRRLSRRPSRARCRPSPSLSKNSGRRHKTDNESDESEESESAEEETETIPKFPNNTYSDLMTLIIQHNLNNKAENAIIRFFNKHLNLPTSPLPKNIEQGRKLMDRMKLINLLNKEKVILKYNNKDYIIYYRPIINCIKNILSIKDIHKYITFNFKNDQTNNNRNYNEQYTSNWWARTEKTLPTGSYLLSIILYSDASTTDSLGKNTLHPIFVTLGNIITIHVPKIDFGFLRNKPDVKQLLAYLPIIKAKDDTQKISEEHKNIVCRTFHKSLKFLLSSLYDDNGIELELNNSIFWCFPRISMIISDWPEACTFALTYKSTKSNYPCHFCFVSKEDLSNINLNSNQIEPRSHNNMKLYYKNNTGKNISIENVRNFFWSVPNINIYAATVPDRMHHLDLGFFQHQLNFTKILINKQCGKSFIDKMNNRVKLIPRYKDLKSFPNGFLHLALLTASEYWSLMKIMIFIVDELYEDSGKNYEESDVTFLQESINEWAKLFIELFKEHSKSELQFPKLHSWVFHICSSIRKFGAINRYTTETYESLKIMSKSLIN